MVLYLLLMPAQAEAVALRGAIAIREKWQLRPQDMSLSQVPLTLVN